MVATGTRPAGRLAGPAAAAARRSRGPGWWAVVTLAALLVAAPPASGQGSGRRLALVVGNDAYRAQSALRNAVNDARAVASALGAVGFAVTRVENANRARLTSALSAFAGSLRGDDVALFYFAGHGVQVDGVNYLMPTDYTGQSSSALRFDAVSASDVQEMLRPARVAMLVFDACRNNPYRGVRGGTGLAPMEARGTLVAYAAGAGEVAADAAPGEANGLFTSKLVEALREPGLTASALFMRVRQEVVAAPNEEQWPAVYNNLLADFVFRPALTAGGGTGGAAAAAGSATASLRQETVFWETIRASTDPADFEAYLELFANGTFSRLARNRLAALRRPGNVSRPSADPPRRRRPGASADGRVALVVGNGDYAAIGRLPNPGNDANDVAAALGRLGFDVTRVRDADRLAMSEALRAFTRESAQADVALVFYAGHGLEVDGVNYLVPVDARLERDTDVPFEAIELDDVLAAMAGAGLRVVVLDACRNNPLARSMQRTSRTRSVSRGSFGELNEDLLGDETLVAYAAAAGTTAVDGTGRNSPYTTALLEYLEQPLELSQLFRRVRAQVLRATGLKQRPHEYTSLLEDHYLGGTRGAYTGRSGSRTSAEVAR